MPRPPDTVLVIEDDRECREALSFVLEHEGHTVAVAENGLAALHYLDTHPAPALILLDLMLPRMNGWQFVAESRSRPQLAAVPIVLVSGEHDLPRHARDLAAVGCVRKPFDVDEMLAVVRAHLPTREHRPSASRIPEPPRATAKPAALDGLRVLVVDDDPLLVDALTILLATDGAQTAGAGSVAEAWRSIQRTRPDVVVIDSVMGDEDGASLIQRIRADASTRELHAIALTGDAVPGQRERALAAGFDRYMSKPFDFDELRSQIAQGRRR